MIVYMLSLIIHGFYDVIFYVWFTITLCLVLKKLVSKSIAKKCKKFIRENGNV